MRRQFSLLSNNQAGFTLTELLVVMGIITVLFALSTVGLGKTQSVVSTSTTVDTLLADIKSQQLLAMAGGVGNPSNTTAQSQGIYVQSNQYTLYAGSTFNAGDSNNYVVAAGQNISFSTTFSGGKVLFNKGAGDVSGFVNGSNTITITSSTSGSKTITINRLGATSVN